MADTPLHHSEQYTAQLTRQTLVWVLTALVLFPVLAILGLLMRILQSGYFQAVSPEFSVGAGAASCAKLGTADPA